MSSEFQFGLSYTRGRTSGVERDRRHAIAERHGCTWTEVWDIPNGCWKSWFSKKNEGDPFDGRAAMAVLDELNEVSNG